MSPCSRARIDAVSAHPVSATTTHLHENQFPCKPLGDEGVLPDGHQSPGGSYIKVENSPKVGVEMVSITIRPELPFRSVFKEVSQC